MVEIKSVIEGLTTSPQHQRCVLETYFLPNGAFDHPLCRVSRFYFPITSRFVVLSIYRWYKILSPVTKIDIKSVGRVPLVQPIPELVARIMLTAVQRSTNVKEGYTLIVPKYSPSGLSPGITLLRI